jgi:ferredoxin-NADP reductase
VVRVKLKHRELVARQTVAFYFEKPRGFQFKPGQFVDLTLIDPTETDEEGNKRSFSIASAPSSGTLTIVTRMRQSAFKRTLGSLPIGGEVELEGPMGAFVLPEPPRNLVFVAGGIGITPFLSMLRDVSEVSSVEDWVLFYSNREPDDAAFLEELTRLHDRRVGFRLVATMTAHPTLEQPWAGETGRIDQQMLLKHLANPAEPTYYIAGPPEMIRGTRQLLADLGIARRSIRFEVFLGYEQPR